MVRSVLSLGFCWVVASVAMAQSPQEVAPAPADSTKVQAGMDPAAEQALAELLAGNRRFMDQQPAHPHAGAHWRTLLSKGQNPKAAILGCADSRVPPELLFDQGFGDLFTIRTAGNVVDPDVIGSLEYAARHLATPLIVVLGHEHCGAVTAALAACEDASHQAEQDQKITTKTGGTGPSASEPWDLEHLLASIRPALETVPQDLPKERRIETAVEANVRYSVEQLRQIPGLVDPITGKRPAIVGAVYHLETGQVRLVGN